MYTIKQAAMRTGVTVPVLRAWERRYGIVDPVRTATGYRLYDEADLRRILAMRRLVDDGWAPSTAAAAVLDGSVPVPPAGPEAGASPPPDGPDAGDGAAAARIRAFVAAAGELDVPAIERVLDEMFATGTFERVAEDHLLPALRAVGDAWASGEVDVAGEHAASAAIHRRLAAAFQAAAAPAAAPGEAVLVGLPPGARHELGALAFGVALRRAGLPVLYLGADLPVQDWVATAIRTRARGAVVGAVAGDDAAAAARVVEALRAARPGMPVMVGGRGAPRVAAGAVVLPDGLTAAIDAARGAVESWSGER